MNELLNKIKPTNEKISDKYSSNLYKFIKKYKNKYTKVFFHPISNWDGSEVKLDMNNLDGSQVYIGEISDEDMTGKSLMNILTGQKIYTVHCYYNIKNDLINITDEFWDKYVDVGRCLFIGHNGWYQDDCNTRFTYLDDKTRKCNWCEKIQHKRIEEMVRKKEIWE